MNLYDYHKQPKKLAHYNEVTDNAQFLIEILDDLIMGLFDSDNDIMEIFVGEYSKIAPLLLKISAINDPLAIESTQSSIRWLEGELEQLEFEADETELASDRMRVMKLSRLIEQLKIALLEHGAE